MGIVREGAGFLIRRVIMGREIRHVPENWEHPKDENGNYIPIEEWKEEDCVCFQM